MVLLYTEISVSHNFMETEAYSLRFGEFKAVGKEVICSLANTVDG